MDLSGDFRSRASEIFYDPTHLTPLGHRLTAETILDHLKELHWTE